MKRVLVTIHGIGRIEADFWVPQRAALARHLDAAPHLHPVWWGDLVDAGAGLPQVRERLNNRIHAAAENWFGRPSRYAHRLVAHLANWLHEFINGAAGVVGYFIPDQKQAIIRERLVRTLTELTERGFEIVLVSESLGSVIAFDVLRAQAHRFRLAAWITVGCPLRLLVRTGQRSADLGAINVTTVRRWVNLHAPCDPIAAPVAGAFPGYPVCDQRIDGSGGPFEAHGRYWHNPASTALIAQTLHA